MKEQVANNEQIGFRDREIPVKDLDKLTLDPSDVSLSESTSDHRPMDVLQSRIIGVFGGGDEGAEENAVKGPLFGLYGKIGFGTLDVDQSNEEVGDGNLGSLDEIRDEVGELGVFVRTSGRTSARRSWEIESKVDDFDR